MIFTLSVLGVLVSLQMFSLAVLHTYAANIQITAVVYCVKIGDTCVSDNVVELVEDYDENFGEDKVYTPPEI